MIKLLQIAFIMSLFISCKEFIARAIGKRAKRIILGKIDINNKRLNINKNLIKGVLIFISVLLVSIVSGYNIIFSCLIALGSIGILLGTKLLKKVATKNQVLCDLLSISECLRVQLSSHIPLGNILRTLPTLCVNREFASLVTNICLEYELSKFVILDASNMLISKFDYPEIRIFISSLNQQVQGASGLEAFDNLIYMLRERYVEFLEDSTKGKMAIMTAGVFVIVVNIAAIGIYPVATEAFNAINIMLK